MADSNDGILELMAKAGDLPYGAAQVALLEEAVQLADSANDLDLGFETRGELMEAAVFSGRPDILLVAFSWCLAQCDRNPDRFSPEEILWKYKWVVENAISFPDVSRARLEELVADMERRYSEAGSTLQAVAFIRRTLYMCLGEWTQARAAHAEFRKRGRDWLSDCPACIASQDCEYFSRQKQWTRAVHAVEPVLKNQLACAEEPHRALSRVLRPLFQMGRLEEAKDYQRRGYTLVGGANQFAREQAAHLQFLVLIADMAQAKRLIERHLPTALEAIAADERFQFLLAARLWTERLLGQDVRTLKVHLPQGLPAADAEGYSNVAALGEWFTIRARDIARRFDARNRTECFQQQLDELPELLRLAVD
jgi:hypothetical protein